MRDPCVIDDDECLGCAGVVDIGNDSFPLCSFHERELCELGERAFEEWYSIELADARNPND